VSKNIQTWVDLFAEDAVFESPYAPGTGGLRRQSHLQLHQKRSSQMQDLMFTNIRVYPTINPNIWAEFHGEAVAVQVATINKIMCCGWKLGRSITIIEQVVSTGKPVLASSDVSRS